MPRVSEAITLLACIKKWNLASFLKNIRKIIDFLQFSFDIFKMRAENRALHLAGKVFRSRPSYSGIQFVLPLSWSVCVFG